MRVSFIAAICALLLWQPAQAQQLLTPQEFGDAAIALIVHNAPDAEIERRDPLSIFVRQPSNTEIPEFMMNFDNAYDEYQRDPAALTEILDRWSRLATEPPENAQMRERVVSVLRPRATIEQFEAQVAAMREPDSPPSDLVWRPFAGDLVEMLAFDAPETIQYAMVQTLTEIGLSPEDAWTIAPSNLPARLGQLELGDVEGARDLVYVTGGNGLAPSSLTTFCATENSANYIFLIVERNGYIMAERNRARALAQFRALYDELMRDGASMSGTPLACEGGQMRPVALTD